MRRGQGSLEYLIILVAVLGLATLAVLVASNISTSSSKSTNVLNDKNGCGMSGITLIDYNTAYTGEENTAPKQIKPCGTCSPLARSDIVGKIDFSRCKMTSNCKLQHRYNLTSCFVPGRGWSAILENISGGYITYGNPPLIRFYPVKWTVGPSAKNSECGSTSDSNAATISNNNGINITFRVENPDASGFRACVYPISGGISITNGTTEKPLSALEWGCIRVTPVEGNVTLVVKGLSGNSICYGIGEPSEKYTKPPYVEPL